MINQIGINYLITNVYILYWLYLQQSSSNDTSVNKMIVQNYTYTNNFCFGYLFRLTTSSKFFEWLCSFGMTWTWQPTSQHNGAIICKWNVMVYRNWTRIDKKVNHQHLNAIVVSLTLFEALPKVIFNWLWDHIYIIFEIWLT